MTRDEKQALIGQLSEKLGEYPHFYIVDMGGLNASDTSVLRRACFEQGVELVMVKNTLFRLALDAAGKGDLVGDLSEVMCGSTSVFFTSVANAPAKLVKEFRKTHEKPILKAAYVEESLYLGDGELDTLATLKSRDELIADVMMLLQSPVNNVLSALQSGGQKMLGVLETLGDR